MALSFLPYLVGGLLLGAVADRLPPRRVLVLGDVASAGLVAAMLIPGLPVAGMLALLLGIGLIAPVYSATRSALLPEILPPGPGYVLGRSLLRMVAQAAQIVGYGVGGLLLALLSPRGALAVDAVSFLASAALLRWGTRRRAARTGHAGSLARDSLAGLRAVLHHRPTRRILLFAWAVPVCEIAPEALATPYATHIGQPARVAGFLMAGMPVGIVLADSLAARVLSTRAQRRIIVPSALLVFVPLALFAVSPGLPAAIALLIAAGLGSAWVAGLDGLLIDVVPVPLRSRALGAMGAGLMFVQGAGFALWGIAGQYLPPDVVITVAAVAGGAAVLLLRPRLAPTARARPAGSAAAGGDDGW
jgi:MFS family permease